MAIEREAGEATERVPVLPLRDVIDCHGPDGGEIDFLKVDVEGWEGAVLASADWVRHRPRVLLIEAVDDQGRPTHEAWEPAVLAGGYRFALFDGVNRFYCREEDAERLLPRLAAPANVLDNWQRADDAHAREQAARLPGCEQATVAARQQAEAAEARSAALVADLERTRGLEAAERRRAEVAVVDAARARAASAAALRREELAETRMAELEMDAARTGHEAAAARLSAENAMNRAAQLSADLARTVEQASRLNAWVEAMRASTSWRVTAPIRWIIGSARGARRER